MTVVEISKKNLIHNLRQFRKRVGKRIKIMAVVKANAYGHGIKEVAKIASQNGADWLGVNSLEEGLLLRKINLRQPILILGYISLSKIKEAIQHNLSFVVYNPVAIKRANRVARLEKKAKVHLKIETGTHRQGINLADLEKFTKLCLTSKNLVIEGIHTHYANIEDTLDHRFAISQLAKFKKAAKLVKKLGFRPLCHTACSAAVILYPKTYFDLVRLGIGLYGLWPSREVKILTDRSKKAKFELRPVLSWKTIIAQIKQVAKGETVGYGRTFKASREMKIAIIPVGYWDGYDRKLSNCGRVLVKGQFAPVVGRICMNMFMVDVSEIANLKPEEEVVLIGKQGKNEITTEELAEKIGTINYEVVTRINPLIPRKVV